MTLKETTGQWQQVSIFNKVGVATKKKKKNHFMVGGHHSVRNCVEGHSSRKAENIELSSAFPQMSIS